MSQTAITKAFEEWKARQGESGEPVLLDEFIFASVPGLDPSKPVDRSEGIPPDAQIVHRQAITRKGVVNENAVVHSVVLGADVGDFSFNWIGLVNKASGVLAMIVHAPAQQKLKTKDGQQGNVLTRSFLMEYSGAQQETGITTPAETWQIDFTARMAAMDERQRLENVDIYGAGAFFGDGWLVAKTGSQYFVTRGAGYVAGLRAQLDANQDISVSAKPVKVWLDVCWTGTLASVWGVQSKITVAADHASYEQNGVKHYVFALASIDSAGVITDLRPKGSLGDQQATNDFVRKDRNLADLKDKAESRESLGVYSKQDVDAADKKSLDAAQQANLNADARVAKKGDQMTGPLVSTYVDALRFKQAQRSFFFRFDGSNFYLLKTKASDPDGSWDDARPITVNANSGEVSLGQTRVNGNLFVGDRGAWIASDGNIWGTRWNANGQWLWDAISQNIQNVLNRADDAWNKANDAQLNRVQSFRLAGLGEAGNGNNDNAYAAAPDGTVVVGVTQKTNWTAVRYRYPQILVNGNWYNVGVA